MTDSTQRSQPAEAKGAVPLEVFTDEELAILAGSDGVVVTPFLDRVGADQRPAVDRTAFRSLLARGILDPPSPEALAQAAAGTKRDGAAVELPVREDVRAMITLRTTATTVIAAARTTATGQDFWYAHVVAQACLLEQVGSDGMHRFALLDAAELPDAVVAAALHPEAGDAVGEPLEFDPSPETALPPRIVDTLGEALVARTSWSGWQETRDLS